MKIRQVEAELFLADRHVTKLIIAFRNFANVRLVGSASMDALPTNRT